MCAIYLADDNLLEEESLEALLVLAREHGFRACSRKPHAESAFDHGVQLAPGRLVAEIARDRRHEELCDASHNSSERG